MVNIGDRVRVLPFQPEVGDEEVGSVGVVADIDDGSYPIAVELDEDFRSQEEQDFIKTHAEEDGEPVEEALWVYYSERHLEIIND